MDRATARRPGVIRLDLDGIVAFPGISHPRVVGTDVRDADGRLTMLQQALSAELEAEGFTPERRRYRPHITLAYVRKKVRPDGLEELRSALRKAEPETAVSFHAAEILLIRSTLSPGGSVYEAIHSASLSEASNATSSGESALE